MKTLSAFFLVLGWSLPGLIHAQFEAGIPVASVIDDVLEIRSADLSGDGEVDIIVRQPQAIGWFANEGAGSFATFDTIHVSLGGLMAFDMGDVGGDGLLDLVIGDEAADSVLLLTNNGSGAFNTPVGVFGLDGALVRSVALADVLGDASPDLVVNTSSQIQAVENVAGAFGAPQTIFSGGVILQEVYPVDADEDGDLDLVTFVGLSGSLTISINPGSSGGPWTNGPGVGLLAGSKPMRVLDVDGDGDLDLANATNHSLSWVDLDPDETGSIAPRFVSGATLSMLRIGSTVRLGCGAGATMLWTDSFNEPVQWTTYDTVLGDFGPVSTLPGLPSFQAIASGDVNGDGLEDLVLWHGENSLSWFANNIVAPTQEVIIAPFDTLCNAPTPYPLVQAQQPGGTWSGAGVTENSFTPFAAGGSALFYTILDEQFGCPITGTRSIEVIGTPTVIAATALDDPCATGQIQLTGLPAGGVWSGAANVEGIIDNDTLSRPYQGGLFYTFVDASGNTCEYGEMYQLQSYSTLGYTNPGTYCLGAGVGTFELYGPMNGGVSVTGSGISGYTTNGMVTTVEFDPGVGLGNHGIVITSTSPLHCTTVVTDSILVSVCTVTEEGSEELAVPFIFPSPSTSGFVTIHRDGQGPVQFIDSSGRLALTVGPDQQNGTIDIQGLQPGLYTVVALSTGQRRIGRLLVE
ncbi:MAG: T9SS type A sorting domain-containing protein [Flavobacteriales bacterium]|nr:T9SS type A sorting domain-containing protein [Flavobacteriales bacterium]